VAHQTRIEYVSMLYLFLPSYDRIPLEKPQCRKAEV
jgi:hypothetical protein